MNNFYSLQQVFNYFSSCLMCKYGMGMDCLTGAPISNVAIGIEFDNHGLGDYYPSLTYRLQESSFDEEFKIDTRNNRVYRKLKEHYRDEIVGGYSTNVQFVNKCSYPQVAGVKYLYLGGSCSKCKQYNYVLQLLVKLDPLCLTDIVFNSETCIFQDYLRGERWELKNVYTTQKTIYTHFAEPVLNTLIREAGQELPLLPLDRSEPNKTLERVKNLLIFT